MFEFARNSKNGTTAKNKQTILKCTYPHAIVVQCIVRPSNSNFRRHFRLAVFLCTWRWFSRTGSHRTSSLTPFDAVASVNFQSAARSHALMEWKAMLTYKSANAAGTWLHFGCRLYHTCVDTVKIEIRFGFREICFFGIASSVQIGCGKLKWWWHNIRVYYLYNTTTTMWYTYTRISGTWSEE